jgi:adenylate cyclase class 2
MLEAEIKIKLKSKEKTIENINLMSGKLKMNLKHSDIYYNAPKELRDFSKTDEALRLRSSIQFDPKTKKKVEEKHELTYKGPKLATTVKSRLECETEISNPEEMEKIILALGFRKIITIKKNRILYIVPFQSKELTVLIDQIEGLEGFYLEAEIMVADSKDLEQAKKILIGFAEKIGYGEKDSIRESYLELVMKKLQKKE